MDTTTAPNTEGPVIESRSQQTYVVKRGFDSYTAKRSAESINFTGTWRWQYKPRPKVAVGVASLRAL